MSDLAAVGIYAAALAAAGLAAWLAHHFTRPSEPSPRVMEREAYSHCYPRRRCGIDVLPVGRLRGEVPTNRKGSR